METPRESEKEERCPGGWLKEGLVEKETRREAGDAAAEDKVKGGEGCGRGPVAEFLREGVEYVRARE